MSITAAIVVYAVTWFMVFFIVLPIRFKSQADAGEVLPGTPRSAPAGAEVGRKARITSVVAVVIWGLIYAVVSSGRITIRDIDVMGVMGPAAAD
jgi:predicted secreted protein